MADISISNLVKTYPGGTERATDDVSLEIADGDFTVLLGPSGCGKTTLLRMLAGLELPDSGSISIGGRDVTYLPPNKRNISMVFQSYAVFPHRSVRYNIGFGLQMAKMPKSDIEKKVQWAAELLQLGPYLDRLPAQLSGGQRQRVAVARAIVVDADVLLMDEPLSNLDALLRLNFRSELKKIVQDLGTTTVYVTHDQSEALSLGDQVAVMRKGRIAQLGGPLDVYDAPSDRFVGGFIGSPPMNFIDAAVTADGDTLVVGDQKLMAPSLLRSFKASDIVLGVRAENVAVGTQRSSGDIAATVLVVEPMGSTVLLTVDVEGQTLKVQAPPTFRTAPHQTIWLSFSPNTMRFYDRETSMALEAK
ncbi:ABC transporter ATP-binding protein [Arthrobacter pascens]|uniref:ABC transporter ATP-binding protein n=1 Tax=Arthrobacter pascens TaxID=1677 RepID=UPI00196B6D87|nr:ABC transporter ATP-binding protein [Arthrobacter pascens]MBN3499834.1 ABC transporter ATP-binding protein [Arthrobacter pascens]MDR6557657.1 multiple sugar transport system ATP-binding protein [Arthrobacter pascens]